MKELLHNRMVYLNPQIYGNSSADQIMSIFHPKSYKLWLKEWPEIENYEDFFEGSEKNAWKIFQDIKP